MTASHIMTASNDSRTRILVVDDEHLIRWSLRQRLEDEGHEVLEAAQGREALEAFGKGCDLVLLDWLLPDLNGQDVLRQMRSMDPAIPVIMLTAHSSVEHAVDVMKEGAFHYAGKPFDLDEVIELVSMALEAANSPAPQPTTDPRTPSVETMLGASAAIQEVRSLLGKIASSPEATVLITGESGSGKGLAAQQIHRSSGRARGVFSMVTCSSLPPALLESELFGHDAGAFADASEAKAGLFERSPGGTVFLDDVGDLTPSVQARLLRLLEDRTFRRVGGTATLRADVRIIAASSTDLRAKVEEGTFREDLYYRLAVLTVRLPPLRERGGDVRLLVDHFVRRFATEFDKTIDSVEPGAMRALETHAWPGNVRELRNRVERAVLLSDGPTLRLDAFELESSVPTTNEKFDLPAQGVDLQDLERRLLIQALERANGNRTRAGQLLGMNRDQVRYRIEKFELEDLDPKRRQGR